MPTFYGNHTTVQLSTANILPATTTNPVLNKGSLCTYNVESAINEIAKASVNGTLAEDAIEDEANGTSVRFLGKHKDMPFLMVQAGKGFYETGRQVRRTNRVARMPEAVSSEQSALDTREAPGGCSEKVRDLRQTADAENRLGNQCSRSSNTSELHIPYALCLTCFLTPSSFIGAKAKRKHGVFDDIKIDVYFNGRLADSVFVSARFRKDQFKMKQHVVRFTGERIHRMLEKPWILNPPEPMSDPSKSPVASERWAAISSNLLDQADKLGRNRNDERPPSGEYLETLAQQEFPKNISGLESPQVGIIDVIISYGQGTKLGPDTPYLMDPKPLTLRGFRNGAEPDEGESESSSQDSDTELPSILTKGLELSKEATGLMRGPLAYTAKSTRSGTCYSNENYKLSHLMGFIEAGDSSAKRRALSDIKNGAVDLSPISKLREPTAQVGIVGRSTTSMPTPRSAEPAMPRAMLRPSRLDNDSDIPMTDAPPLNSYSTRSPTKSLGEASPATAQAASLLIELSKPYQERLNTNPMPMTRPSTPPSLLAPFARPHDQTQNHQHYSPVQLTRESSFQGTVNPFDTSVPSLASSPLTTPPSSPTMCPSHSPNVKKWVNLKYTSPLQSSSSTSQDTSPFRAPRSRNDDEQLHQEPLGFRGVNENLSGSCANQPVGIGSYDGSLDDLDLELLDENPRDDQDKDIEMEYTTSPEVATLRSSKLKEGSATQNQPRRSTRKPINTTPNPDPITSFPTQIQQQTPQSPSQARTTVTTTRAMTTRPTTPLNSLAPKGSSTINNHSSSNTNTTKSLPSFRKPRTPKPPASQLSEIDQNFHPSPLSEDCRIRYAPQGVVRQVSSVREGWFDERGIVVGVRFVVG